MASLEESVKAALVADGAINAIIEGRCYLLQEPPEGSVPNLVYHVIDDVPQGDTMGTTPPNQRARLQVTSWHNGMIEALALARLVRLALKDFTGVLGGGVTVERIFVDIQRNGDPPGADKVRSVIQDYIVAYLYE